MPKKPIKEKKRKIMKKDRTDYGVEIRRILTRYHNSMLLFIDREGKNHYHEIVDEIISLFKPRLK